MLSSKDIISDWISKKYHKTHNWHTGTGRFIKKLLARKVRHNKEWKRDL
jgi:hypothetical protein